MTTSVKQYLKLLLNYLKPQKLSVTFLGILILASIVLQIINPQILRFFLDATMGGETANVLFRAALIFIGISLSQQLLSLLLTYMCQNIGWTATNALREDLILHCIGLDMDFHKSKQPGEIIERLDSDVNFLFEFFSRLILDMFANSLLLIGILLILLREDWRISTSLIIFAIGSVLILSWYQLKGVSLWSKERETSGKFFGFLGEQLANTEDIKSSGSIDNSMFKYHRFVQELFPAILEANMLSYKLWNISTVLSATGMVIALGVGGYLWSKEIITIGTVYLILNYTLLMNGPLEKIRRQFAVLQKAGASIRRIQELLNIKSSITGGVETLPSTVPAAVEIRNLSFQYSTDTPVLKNISFHLKPNRVLGILGRTGSGKTTLARLLVRLYDPNEGQILIDNKNIKNVKLESLRSHVAYVTQEVQLFKTTVRENLTFFDPTIDDSTILNILEEIGLKGWVDSLDDGLDTVLDSEGGSLSSGEGQILALARVFLKKPGLIILDEASSRLDPITERLMEKALDVLLVNRSSVIIAHRLSTLERADDILILDKGEIIEYGSREELAKNKDTKYYQLLQRGIEEVLV